jgi:NarL family two-component system response regulator LiaR
VFKIESTIQEQIMAPTNSSITIVLVDDHQVVRLGLNAYFATQPDIEVVAEAGTGQEAVILVQELAPDVVLMDLHMPGMDGVEATRQIRTVSPRTQVIVVTSHNDDEYIFPAIRAGALSYLLKDIDPDELAAAVRKAHQGEAVLNSQVAARVIKEVQGVRDEKLNPFRELTDRELEILRLIAGGMDNQSIADQLVISIKTVKGHVTNILSKLHLADRTQAAVYAWREGIVRRSQSADDRK